MDIYNELKEYGIEPVVADPEADAAEAEREYGIKLTDIKDIKNVDAVILAVAHNKFKEMTAADIASLFKNEPNNKKVFLDIKGLFDRKEFESAGYNYWRL